MFAFGLSLTHSLTHLLTPCHACSGGTPNIHHLQYGVNRLSGIPPVTQREQGMSKMLWTMTNVTAQEGLSNGYTTYKELRPIIGSDNCRNTNVKSDSFYSNTQSSFEKHTSKMEIGFEQKFDLSADLAQIPGNNFNRHYFPRTGRWISCLARTEGLQLMIIGR